jgi:hypothetical protein
MIVFAAIRNAHYQLCRVKKNGHRCDDHFCGFSFLNIPDLEPKTNTCILLLFIEAKDSYWILGLRPSANEGHKAQRPIIAN